MAARDRSARRPSASHRAPTRPGARAPWPDGPVAIPTGTVELVRDPDDPHGVTVLVNGVPSSYLDLADPAALAFEYMQQMALVLDRLDDGTQPIDVVHLGAAGCALARAVHARRPGSRQVAVELDAALPELVRGWFDLPRSPALRIRAGDAREQLAAMPDASADVVVRDVFAGSTTPAHVVTREMAGEVVRVLRPGGVYLVNCADRPPLAAARSECATLADAFGDVAAVAEPGILRGRGYGNLVLVGTDRTDLLGSAALARAVRSLPAPARLLHGEELAAFVGRAPVLRDPETP
ncbi:methyltransferase domain-containing protein [Cellulomonas rhizosphaerae]|uniref:Methyltransferase domain-containing protein n=1 Tax=Cellulomonas rhizosphaerae TaxID=2293719 RepID=A0A413RPB6_9CELL|nr:methyltransferase domain-containing protein [Cellulomonas rhizosphaerae]